MSACTQQEHCWHFVGYVTVSHGPHAPRREERASALRCCFCAAYETPTGKPLSAETIDFLEHCRP